MNRQPPKSLPPNTPVPGWSHAYSFDEIGNRKTATTNGRVSIYTPNPLNQIDSRTIPRAFDVIGKANPLAAVTINGTVATRLDEYFYKELTTTNTGKIHIPYTVAATDSSTTTRDGGKFLAATPEAFTYDLDGNLISDGRFTYTWDAENRLIAMEAHATVPFPARRKLAFFYDAMNRRISKIVWHGTISGGWQLHHKFDFIHELGGWNILAERSGGSKDTFLRTYTWGTDLSGDLSGAGGIGGLLFTKLYTSSKTFANAMDLNGNVTLLVDTATGQSAATYDYGPFGEPLRQSGEYASLNPFRFSTKYTDDETGLVDYGLRPYNPSSGTWLNRDPIGEKGGINLYGFLSNNSINRFDFLGLIDPNTDSWHHIYSQSVFTKDFLKRHCITLDIDSSENGWIMLWKDHSQVDHRLGWTREWKAWVKDNDTGAQSITLDMIKEQKKTMFSNYELEKVGYQSTVGYKKSGRWKTLLKDGVNKKQSIAVVVGMLFVAASLNEVEAGDLSKIANVSIQVRQASDFSEEYSAKLELIELIVNASGLPENYVALWVDSQVKPQ